MSSHRRELSDLQQRLTNLELIQTWNNSENKSTEKSYSSLFQGNTYVLYEKLRVALQSRNYYRSSWGYLTPSICRRSDLEGPYQEISPNFYVSFRAKNILEGSTLTDRGQAWDKVTEGSNILETNLFSLEPEGSAGYVLSSYLGKMLRDKESLGQDLRVLGEEGFCLKLDMSIMCLRKYRIGLTRLICQALKDYSKQDKDIQLVCEGANLVFNPSLVFKPLDELSYRAWAFRKNEEGWLTWIDPDEYVVDCSSYYLQRLTMGQTVVVDLKASKDTHPSLLVPLSLIKKLLSAQ